VDTKFGDPLIRPVKKVVLDVKNGYITVKQAERDYGVVLDPDTLELIELSTERQAKEEI
jgi:N-methylhydantoinase B